MSGAFCGSHFLPLILKSMTPTLEGTRLRLEPLTLDHLPALEKIALDPIAKPAIWRYMIRWPQNAADLRAWVESALHDESEGTTLRGSQS